MSKHKLFIVDSNSPFNSSESSTPRNCKSGVVIKSGSITFLEGAERKNSFINTSGAKTNMKRTKFDSDASGPRSVKNCHPALMPDPVTLKPGTEITNICEEDTSVVEKTSGKKNPNCAPSTSPEVSDFDSDIVEVDFFSKFNQKLPYSKQEDELILQYVLKGQNIFKVSSLSLWKYLEFKKENPKRTYQSLKNRFMRNIKPCLFTTYRHLITNKETVDNILVKFPELKKQMGIKDTLSKIALPARKSPPKLLKTVAQAGKDIDEYQENIERTISMRALKSNDILDPVVQLSQESSQLNPLNNSSFYRKVTFGKKSIFISVSLIDRNHSEAPVSSLMKISERFKKLRKKRERHFCPVCGRYNRHHREGDSSESDEESDIMIPNSVDENKKSPRNLKKRNFQSNLSSNQRTNCKIPSSEYSVRNQDSQSLLNYDGKEDDRDKRALDADEDNRSTDLTEQKISDHSNSLISKNKAVKVESVAKDIQVQEKSKLTISKKKKKASLETEKQWDSDGEIDIIYESTVAGFRKLIDADEEKILFRKCLYKNRDSIGFNSDSEKNLDSYFLESSSEVETPTLTENYSTLTQNSSGKTRSKNACNSHLASNMIKMLAKEKDRNKKF